MKIFKRLVSATTAIVLAVFFSATSYAHTDISNIQHDAANNKWDIYETGHSITRHSSGNGIYVICDSSLTSQTEYSTTWSNYVDAAISAWTSASFNGSNIFSGKITRKTDTYSLSNTDINNQKTLVKIYAIRDADQPYWGQTMFFNDEATYYSKTNSGTHIKYIRVKLNLANLGSKTINNKKYTITHELGHVIGLSDLSSNYNDSSYSDCLMGYNNFSTLAPQSSDIKGAAVISGYHTNHSFTYKYLNSNKHIRACTKCGGYTSIDNHSFGEWCDYGQWQQVSHCTICGYARYRDK